jgi:hypothetical protein
MFIGGVFTGCIFCFCGVLRMVGGRRCVAAVWCLCPPTLSNIYVTFCMYTHIWCGFLLNFSLLSAESEPA